MGQADTEGRREDAGDDDARQGRQIDISQGIGRIARQADRLQTVVNEPGGPREGNGKSDGCGSSDGHVHGHVAPHHERHREGAAADAHQAGNRSDDAAHSDHPQVAGDFPRGFRLTVRQHLSGDVVKENYKESFEEIGGQTGCDTGPQEGPQEDSGNNALNDDPAHRPSFVVCPKTRHGSEDDARHGCPEGQVHDEFMGNLLPGQGKDQHGDNDEPAADSQQSCEDSGNETEGNVEQNDGQHVQLLFSDANGVCRGVRRKMDIRPACPCISYNRFQGASGKPFFAQDGFSWCVHEMIQLPCAPLSGHNGFC